MTALNLKEIVRQLEEIRLAMHDNRESSLENSAHNHVCAAIVNLKAEIIVRKEKDTK